MKYFKVTYSNYNFRVSSLGVKANNESEAIQLAKQYEGQSRFADETAKEITESEFLKFENEAFENEVIRF